MRQALTLVAGLTIAACGGARPPITANHGGTATEVALPGTCTPPAPPPPDVPSGDPRPTAAKALTGIDVDGDGVDDAVLAIAPVDSPDGSCEQRCVFAIYVRRGACGYLVGDVDAQTIEVVAGGSGVRDLQTATTGPDGQAEFHRYHFDGAAYRETEDKECDTHDEDVSPDDRRCGAWESAAPD